jgi:hypothetical protein
VIQAARSLASVLIVLATAGVANATEGADPQSQDGDSGGAAQGSDAPPMEPVPTSALPPSVPPILRAGLTLGTPGGLDWTVIARPEHAGWPQAGIEVTVSLASLLLNGSSDASVDETSFLGLQLGIPIFLLAGRAGFIAVAPVAGVGIYNPDGGDRGRWYYGGAVLEGGIGGVFAQVGVGFGTRRHYAGFGSAGGHVTLLASVGYLWSLDGS